jgi:hypothetical protein
VSHIGRYHARKTTATQLLSAHRLSVMKAEALFIWGFMLAVAI